jgi:hypothetical protein
MQWILTIALALQAADAGKIEAKQKELAAALKQAKTAEGLNYLAEQYLQLVDDASTADLYDAAGKAAEQAAKIASGTKNAGLVDLARQKSAEIRTKSAEFGKARPFLKALEEKPDDPQANLAVGKYLCFVKDDWAKGLPCLAKGSDETLKKLAANDALFAGPGEVAAETRLELADMWWPKSRERALYWYKRAWPNLNPLQKEKVRGLFREVYARGKPVEKKPTPTGWVQDKTDPGTGADEQYASSGRRSLCLVGGKPSAVTPQEWADLRGAKEVVLTMQALSEGGPSSMSSVRIQFWTKDSPDTFEAVPLPGDEPWWQEVRAAVKVPEKATKVKVHLLQPTAGRIWLDQMSLKADGIEVMTNGIGDFER